MGGEDGERASAKNEVNPLKYIEQRVASAFPALVGPKFTAKYATEPNENCVKEFLDNEDVTMLAFSGDNVIASIKMPGALPRGKTVCFTKFHKTAITSKNVLSDIMVNELTPSSVEYLERMVSEVYLPLFSNAANQEGWGEVASKEVVDKFHSYMASVSIISGATKGETCLPLPPIDGNATNLSNKVSLLEGSIVIWTKQIKNVLKQDPEDLLKQGLHPTPDAEIEFWKLKAANLNSIFDQLQSKKVRKILTALDRSKSTYCTTFARLCKEVFTARIEANDNMKYLRTLEEWFIRLNNDEDFPALTELFKPMLHIILLIWKNSKHYNTPARLVVLMREICNSLINQARKYLSGELIFALIDQDEAGQAVEQLKTTLQVCSAFKSTYFDYKATANAECPSNPWRIQGNALFVRLDSFLERCHDILDLTQTIVQFSKLSKIEVGGTKGKTLTLSVQQIHADFTEAVNTFKGFDDNFYDFRCKIKELERRLGSVLTQGFDDCSTIFGRFKLLDSFEGLLNRPIIQDELEKKHVALVQSYGHDLKLVQELFLHCRDAPPISWNLPPVAGALTWCRGLVERIEHPMKKLRELNQNVMEREEAKEVYKVYGTIMASLQEYENQKVEEWSRDVEASSQAKLKLPLLLRHPQTRCLRVNFDPALEKLLREIKYLRLLSIDVPQSALQISTKEETFRKYRGELMYIVEPYNAMIEGIHPLEEPLVRRHIQNIDACAGRGIEELNWKSAGIDTFIDECRKAVEGANEIVINLKDNLNTIQETLGAWNSPLLERQAKPVAVAEHERQHKSYIVQRTLKIREGATEIHRRLKQSNTGIVGVNSAQWKAYVDYVNNIVVNGVARVICSSLEFLAKQLDPSGGKDGGNRLPMLEIKLDLIANRVQFNPSIGENHGKGLSDTIQMWINSFFNVATAVKRLDSDGGGSYLKEMHSDMTISMMLATISEYEEENEAMLVTFKRKYDGYGYLWEADMTAHFQTFLATATVPGANGGADMLNLEKFNTEITKYEQVASEIENLTTPTDIGWLRVNSQPIKTAMLTWVSKWVYQYTTYLHQHVVNKLSGLHEFMETVIKGLEEQVADKNKDALKRVMTHIRDVRKQMDATNALFDPLREAVHLLKLHGINVEDTKIGDHAVQDYLEAAPMQWEAIVNKTFKKKEEIMPLQMAEVESIKEELESFFLDMRKFRNEFRTTAPFSFQGTPNDAYAQMNSFASALHKKMQMAREFNELEELFELQVSKYQETTDTLYELQQLKKCWDLKDLVLATFDDWKSTLWTSIQTDTFEGYTRAFMKQLKMEATEHQMIKGWQVYKDTEQLVKNMSTVLPLINDLHSEAMQDRHWKALSTICHVKAIEPKDPKFSLADLLKLNLHLHVDDVGEIVETANKEQKIEKKLKMIEELWQRLTLEYVPHKDSGTFVVKPSEEVVESLESNQLELQTMIGMGKFVEFFKDRVLASQKTLGHVEEVLKEWVSVSKQWASLESIFLSSPDIRNQLPDDTRTFESIDSNFKDLMKNAVMEPNAVLACSVDNRLESLKEMTAMLEKCQKSLNEYLDKKKKIFPRFYFVSNVALLEILSNGNNPKKIMPFLGDCYDSLCDLVFEDDSPNTAHTMVAKDGESVRLPTIFVMAGAVESWLNELTEAMRFCLRKEMHDSIETAANWDVEKPRHQWLFDYPAQVVLNSTQIYWTEETEMALEEFENGQEDSVKRYLTVCNQRLEQLINLVLGNLSSPDRCKIIALITLDVHSRDVVKKLVDEKVEGPLSFMWQQQLRFIWRQENYDVDIRITDFRSKYSYEWIGNTGRLVITPLTDRCYITLTMALRLFLGGAPAGPAGTGKTETTKDLARAMALCCYVFNCSDQMNYQTMADIFRGLCQTGTWGCFDEFNRINIEVLSVVATQVKCIQDAIVFNAIPANREAKYQTLPAGTPPVVVGEFEFMGASDRITLIPTCGFFITMNPGYAGRTELPENLKVLFRSCAMIRPDLKPICENMLMSEGFQQARTLAIKFVTLYELSGELLSKQFHYDWGLRAVKSVLRVAGILKRAEPDVEEDKVLMRALRDFNTPKIPHHDTPIFLRLINDLFIGVEVAPKVNVELREKAVAVCKANNLQPDDSFILKICQLQELIDVRHSVMLLGPAGCAKTTTWQALAKCWNLGKEKKICVYETLNPKAVTSDELYGYMTLSKDWKDGVLSIIMRGMAKNYSEQGFYESQSYKWVVLDGDIDAVWIESMNTVMDDNKVLTLVSNERIPLSSAMRMVFEINSLKNATPATVSRAGILFINEIDIGWRPFMESWVAKREEEVERTYLPGLFDKYVDPIYDLMRKGYKQVAPVRLINQVSTICYLLEGLLGNIPTEKKNPEVIESIFVFCATWAFGGPLIVDKSIDYRKNFHELWCSTFTNIKYPKEGLCFDYFYNLESGEFESWSTKVPKYAPGSIGNGPADTPFNSIVISTNDSVRIRFLVETLVARQRPAMLVGGSGTGKTTILKNFLRELDDDMLFSTINMNYYTDSAKLQQQLESVIDKRSGRMFGPPATKKLIYFIDDLNLPYIETYGTQNSLALLRQHMDYRTFFDRIDLGFRKEIVDVQYLSAMNPTAGSFIIDERLQRHYALFACMMPGREDLKTIYNSILRGHMQNAGFASQVMTVCEHIVNVSILLHEEMVNRFLPSATKFVYNWNMRELSNIFQGLTRSKGEFFPTGYSFTRLWVHESTRVFCDRLINDEDIAKFGDRIREVTKKLLPDLDQVALFNDQPPPPPGSEDNAPVPVNIFTTFATAVAGADSVYMPVSSMKALNKVLVEQLDDYNSKYSMMNLELFDNAMEHVTRICRIIGNPGGNAMLIGVGGSGKQSLSRLASHICGFDVRQLSVTSNFRIEDLKENLAEMFKIAGVQGLPLVFLITDSQIVNERFLVYINDMLSSGWIPDLFPKEDLDGLLGALRSEAKANGVPDAMDALMDFLLLRIRLNFRVIMCFSPVGAVFRVRARRFPGLVNCTVIDWFHPWPRDALVRVASSFLEKFEDIGDAPLQRSLANHMADVHISVTDMSKNYFETQRRYNYVTPKSFLELISFYEILLKQRKEDIQRQISRLDDGLSTLRKTSADVAELQVDLKHTMVKVAEKQASTDQLLEQMGREKAGAEVQQENANKEKFKAEAANLVAKGIPITEGIDPLSMLTTEGKNAKMMSEGLPADRISIENGAIITSCKRWPLVIDPQLQGIKWLREKEKDRGLVVLQLSQNQWLRKTETAIVNGHVLIIENIGEEIDATLDPVLGRAVYKKGSNLFLKLAGEEVQYDPNFFMYLQTKLSNPHYKPEIAAQCTLINFIATESGLEDQLLEKVVKKEQPELEARKQELVLAFQKFKIDLVELEDQLLERLANAPDDILSDVPLIESLEETKKKATDISISVKKNQETEIVINNTRELYRPVAAEGAMLYFLLTTLSAIDHMYRYSLDSFITFFYNSIDRAQQSDKQSERVLNLRESLRITIYTWVARGLFEAHKLIFLSQLTFNLMRRGILGDDVRVQEAYMQFLLRGPKKAAGGGGEEEANPIDWLPPAQWSAINMLAQLEEFQKMPQDLKEASSRFREWYNHVTPESEKLPLDWAGLDRTPFLKLLVVRCLRPDRMTVAVNEFVRQVLPNGSNYCDCDSALNTLQVMDNSYLDSTPTTPLYFILSPGADVVAGVDKLSIKYGFERGVSYHNVSMGQGQDVFAMDRLEVAHRNGHWVILNNIHLMPRWLLALEKKLDEFALEGSHKNFRLFLTSDPSNSIPIGVLNRCIKLTNEPPSGLKANLKRAFVSFAKEYIEEAEGKVKSILFGLCHFHAVLMERKMYGPLGFNMMYPFSLGDLRDSAICLQNYLESSAGGKIPWADLRYIFGEIMYGGHIVNDFDRLLANTYLDFYMRDELLDEMEMFPFVGDEKGPSFMCLAPSSYDKYLEHIETELKTDSPLAFGLHPNAEIDFRTTQSENLFRTLMELQPRDAAAGDATMSPLELAKQGLEMVLSRIGEKKFECDEISRNLEEMGPYQNVFIQECEAMNGLLAEVVRSLNELSLGFAGELTMSDAMEAVQESLFLDRVPKSWEKLAFPSMRPLGSWLTNLEARLLQLEEWTQNPADIPRVTWLSGMINPQSFLTAIMQVTAQKNQWELDKLVIQTDVLKRRNGEVDAPSRDGAYIHGLYLMGARWDVQNNTVDRSHPKEMFSPMPVINCKAVASDKLDIKGSYVCPCYKTEFRGPTYVFSAQLKSKSPPARWVLAGVALIMDIV
uniref:AAA+ ATPase domain-containing protein n=1 Tax=Phytophthora ramorum TaxID=164328 RepID=H3HCG5_PHYRM